MTLRARSLLMQYICITVLYCRLCESHKICHSGQSLRSCLAASQAKKKATSLAVQIRKERGVSNGVAAFYSHLPNDFLEEKRRQQAGQPKLSPGVSQSCLSCSEVSLHQVHPCAFIRYDGFKIG